MKENVMRVLDKFNFLRVLFIHFATGYFSLAPHLAWVSPLTPLPFPLYQNPRGKHGITAGGCRVRSYSPCYRKWKKTPWNPVIYTPVPKVPLSSDPGSSRAITVGFSISWESIYHQGLSSLTCTAITDWDSGGCNAHCKGILIPVSVLIHVLHMYQHHLCPYLIAMQ